MLPNLNPDPKVQVDVQQTEFSHDALGRWVSSTWSDVSNNGGDSFDVVVIGAGMFGGYIADKLYRGAPGVDFALLTESFADLNRDCLDQPSRWSMPINRLRERH